MVRALGLVAVAACLTTLAIVNDVHDDGVFFTLVMVPWAFVGRIPGASLGALIGSCARHAMGWLTAFLSAGVAGLFVCGVSNPEQFFQDYRDGLAAAAWMYSLPAATIAEFFWCVFEVRPPPRRSADSSSQR